MMTNKDEEIVPYMRHYLSPNPPKSENEENLQYTKKALE